MSAEPLSCGYHSVFFELCVTSARCPVCGGGWVHSVEESRFPGARHPSGHRNNYREYSIPQRQLFRHLCTQSYVLQGDSFQTFPVVSPVKMYFILQCKIHTTQDLWKQYIYCPHCTLILLIQCSSLHLRNADHNMPYWLWLISHYLWVSANGLPSILGK